MGSYEQLRTWRKAHDLVLMVYRTTATWPASEKYGMTAQVRRAAVSIPANIAEGVAKWGQREFRRYLDIALGSLSELRYLTRLAQELGYQEEANSGNLASQLNETGRLLWRLYQAAKKSSRSERLKV